MNLQDFITSRKNSVKPQEIIVIELSDLSLQDERVMERTPSSTCTSTTRCHSVGSFHKQVMKRYDFQAFNKGSNTKQYNEELKTEFIVDPDSSFVYVESPAFVTQPPTTHVADCHHQDAWLSIENNKKPWISSSVPTSHSSLSSGVPWIGRLELTCGKGARQKSCQNAKDLSKSSALLKLGTSIEVEQEKMRQSISLLAIERVPNDANVSSTKMVTSYDANWGRSCTRDEEPTVKADTALVQSMNESKQGGCPRPSDQASCVAYHPRLEVVNSTSRIASSKTMLMAAVVTPNTKSPQQNTYHGRGGSKEMRTIYTHNRVNEGLKINNEKVSMNASSRLTPIKSTRKELRRKMANVQNTSRRNSTGAG
jgi:hypothetical protein